MFCGKCSRYVEPPAAFCPHCGNKLPEETMAAPVPPPLPWQQSDDQQGLLKRPPILTILAILNFIAGAVYILGSIAVPLIGSQTKEPPFAIWIVIGVLLLVVGILQLICGRGLWTLRSYGRTLQLVLAWIGILGFPFGTIISILILVYLFKPEVKLLFSGKTVVQLHPSEAEALQRFQATGLGGAAVAVIAVVVLMVFITFIGIVAAIAIPNLLNAIERGKQKRTMADMRAIATACEAYAVDHGSYPEAQSINDLAPLLEAKYIRALPQTDGWQHGFLFEPLWDETSVKPSGYAIMSAGKDGVFEYDRAQDYEGGMFTDFDGDIVLTNGVFLRYPQSATQPSPSTVETERDPGIQKSPDARTPLVNSTLGIKLMLPPGWAEDLDLNDQAALQTSYRLKELYVIVLTDDKAQFDEMTIEKHSEITRGSVMKSLANMRLNGPSRLTIQGWPALQYEIHGTFEDIKASYIHTTVETDYYFHQILAWTLTTRWERNKDILQEVTRSFSEIQ